jgi:hypothetical protein
MPFKNVAFVTYNKVGLDGNLSDCWHDGPNNRSAFVLQNTRNDLYVVGDEQRTKEIELLWERLQKTLPVFDHIVVYVGRSGSELAIKLAAQLHPSKVMFVACGCGLSTKVALINAAGLTDAGLVLCECGGHQTMQKLYNLFMETGELSLAVPTQI